MTAVTVDPASLRRFEAEASRDLGLVRARVDAAVEAVAAIASAGPAREATSSLGAITAHLDGLARALATAAWVADEAERLDGALTQAALAPAVRDLAAAPDIERAAQLLLAVDRPATVALVWSALPGSVRDDLVTDHPQLVGPLDGVWPSDRDRANRSLVTAHVAALRARIDDLHDQAAAARRIDDAVGLQAVDLIDREIDALHERIDRVRDLLRTDQVLEFDPRGDGRFVVAWGDVGTADTVATFVPGMTSSLARMTMVTSDARDLATALERTVRHLPDEGHRVATVAWLGYDAPSGPAALALASTDRVAATEAHRLVDWGAGVAAANPTASHAVVAHSYGSVLAAHAVAADTRRDFGVDRLVLLGSPGIGDDFDGLEDLGVPDTTTLHAAATGLDPVVLVPLLGPDPRRLDGVVDLPMGPGNVGHSGYLTPSTLGATNVARAALGLPPVTVRTPWRPHPRGRARPGSDRRDDGD